MALCSRSLVAAIFAGYLARMLLGKEYCQQTEFSAHCDNASVLLMTKAEYGAMYAETCIWDDVSLGCYTDFLRDMDALCSGRSSCRLPVDDFNKKPHACPKGIYKFLDAEYDCVPVDTGAAGSCQNQSVAPIAVDAAFSTGGYVASLFLQRTGEGTPACPWAVSALPGQFFKLYMLDFTLNHYIVRTYGSRPTTCPISLVTSEEGASGVAVPLCNRTWYPPTGSMPDVISPLELPREVHKFTSNTNQLTFHIQGSFDDTASFMIRYEVSGCPDIAPPEGASMRRTDGDTLMVSCPENQQTWYLVCLGTSWRGLAELGNCSDAGLSGSVVTESPGPTTEGILMAVGIGLGIGVVVGLTLLAIVVLCRRCYARKKKREREASLHRARHPLYMSQEEAASAKLEPTVGQSTGLYSDYAGLRGRGGGGHSSSVTTVSSSLTMPRPGSGGEPLYHQYDARTLPSIPVQGTYPSLLQRGVSVEEHDRRPGPGMSVSSSADSLRSHGGSEHIYESAYAMQQMMLQQQQQQYLEQQQLQGSAAPSVADTLRASAAHIAALNQAMVATRGPALHTVQPADVQVHATP